MSGNLTPERIVERDVFVCVSMLMSDLVDLYWTCQGRRKREEWAGKEKPISFDEDQLASLYSDVKHDGETYEVFEHWAVSTWLASKLEEQGERVVEISNLKVWCRTTTGQQISADSVIETICKEVNT